MDQFDDKGKWQTMETKTYVRCSEADSESLQPCSEGFLFLYMEKMKNKNLETRLMEIIVLKGFRNFILSQLSLFVFYRLKSIMWT